MQEHIDGGGSVSLTPIVLLSAVAAGHLGGRWWKDLKGNRVQDAGDHSFQCPLLGPGDETP